MSSLLIKEVTLISICGYRNSISLKRYKPTTLTLYFAQFKFHKLYTAPLNSNLYASKA